MKSLVIVESPAKVKTISKYLGKDFVVKASMGHVVDLPKKEIGIDPEKKYKPKYIITNTKALNNLKQDIDKFDRIIIASDPDREGEAIGWHVAQKLKVIDKNGKPIDPKKKVERITFTSITKDAVNEAINKPRTIDMDLVNAQQTRRIVDRLVGYKLSPLLWKKIQFGLSAGRVQSVAVKLIVDREREREAFKNEEYWSLDAYLQQDKSDSKNKIVIIKKGDEKNDEIEGIKFVYSPAKKSIKLLQKDVEKVSNNVVNEKWIIESIESKEVKRFAKPPFMTSTLQQSASNKMGYSAKRTMQIAQKLYEKGIITYMRTDSVNIESKEADKIQKFIDKKWGKKYLNSAIAFKSSNKNAQEAHEAIRPTDISLDAQAAKLEGDEEKLYNLIRFRTLASFMTPAVLDAQTVKIKVGEYYFTANGQSIKFDGFLKVYPEKVVENELPVLEKAQELFLNKLINTQHFTEPPARYSEATLIKTLEKFGIGRPSTYAPIISTIQARKYVEKEGRYFKPTDIARLVTDMLSKYFESIVDTGFTAQMEEELDQIAEGKMDWVKYLDKFYNPFEEKVVGGEKNIKRDEFTVLGDAPKDIKCPVCGSPMVIKISRFGKFYSCTKFPDCKGMRSIDGKTDEEKAKEMNDRINSQEFKDSYEPAPQTEDGKPFILKTGRYGEFWAHPNYPKVKDARPLVLKRHKLEEIYGEIPKTKDGKDFELKKGRYGEFWAHPDYPKVKEIIKIKKT